MLSDDDNDVASIHIAHAYMPIFLHNIGELVSKNKQFCVVMSWRGV